MPVKKRDKNCTPNYVPVLQWQINIHSEEGDSWHKSCGVKKAVALQQRKVKLEGCWIITGGGGGVQRPAPPLPSPNGPDLPPEMPFTNTKFPILISKTSPCHFPHAPIPTGTNLSVPAMQGLDAVCQANTGLCTGPASS